MEGRRRAVCDEIDAAEAERTQLTLNLEFTKIREGAQLNPREIRIYLDKNSLVDLEVDGNRRKAFAKGLTVTMNKQPAPDVPACAKSSEEAYEAYVDIKERDCEKVISGLRERVEGMQLQTRGEQAQALGCSASALDALLQQHDLRNTDIGLKSTPGRKRHGHGQEHSQPLDMAQKAISRDVDTVKIGCKETISTGQNNEDEEDTQRYSPFRSGAWQRRQAGSLTAFRGRNRLRPRPGL